MLINIIKFPVALTFCPVMLASGYMSKSRFQEVLLSDESALTDVQVEVLHDAMLMVGIHGADLTNLIFLPAKAAVVEIALDCEVGHPALG